MRMAATSYAQTWRFETTEIYPLLILDTKSEIKGVAWPLLPQVEKAALFPPLLSF